MKLSVKSGAIIPVLLMRPGLAWTLFYSLDPGARSDILVALSAAGGVARSAARVLPLFCSLIKTSVWSAVAWVGLAGALAVCYLAFDVLHVWALSLTSL